jgi:UDP-N-acetylglucosamine 2-epimerase (non-hydrolysing)
VYRSFIQTGKKESGIPELWDGNASERIVEILLKK